MIESNLLTPLGKPGVAGSIYSPILETIVVWGVLALGLTRPIILLQPGAKMAGPVFVIGALQILCINKVLLLSQGLKFANVCLETEP